MHDRIEGSASRVVPEHDRGKGRPIEAAVRSDHRIAELRNDGIETGRTRLHNLARDRVGVDDHCTTLCEKLGDGALAGAHSPGQPDTHDATLSPAPACPGWVTLQPDEA